MPKKKHRRGNKRPSQQARTYNDMPPRLSPQKEADIMNLYSALADELQDHPTAISEIVDLMNAKTVDGMELPIHTQLQRMSYILRDFPHLFEQFMAIFPPSWRAAMVPQMRRPGDTGASDGQTGMISMDGSERAQVLARASAAFRAAASMPAPAYTGAHDGYGSTRHNYGGLPQYTPDGVPITWRICDDCADEMREKRRKEAEARKLNGFRDIFRLHFPTGEGVLTDTLWLVTGLLVVGILVEVYM